MTALCWKKYCGCASRKSLIHMRNVIISGDNMPSDILPDEELNLSEYKNLDARWHEWQAVKAVCADCATQIFDHIVGQEPSQTPSLPQLVPSAVKYTPDTPFEA
ncbi:hypothetical protein [Candidatus Amarolinea dominans]|uniref:hypothetical protein n=1 Tax=Candidatus Amarolinea dominans TaxID=3140696 RepID=UPI003135828A|nr:hypothetical protein [Anaerolineae bacterium]